MLILQKSQIILIIILLSIFLCPPAIGKTKASIPIKDLPEESTEAIEAEIISAFDSFSAAKEMINQSDSITSEQLAEYFPEIKIETKKDPLIWIHFNTGNKVWILPSFYWGCFFGPAGVLVAGIATKWQGDYWSDSFAGMAINCNVVFDAAVIAGTVALFYYLMKTYVPILVNMMAGFSEGCNPW